MYKVSAQKEINLTAEDIEDLVVTALNGGIGYWACLDNTTHEWDSYGEDDYVDSFAAKILMCGNELRFIDNEDRETEYVLTLEMLLDGVKRYVEEGYDQYDVFGDEVDMGNCDAEVADMIMQLAMFGDIVF